MLTETVSPALTQFASDVRQGLNTAGQKQLPSKYLYDAVGSALFEVISVIPEYGVTRADERILRSAAEQIATLVPFPLTVCELGSGSGKKTRYILEALSLHAELDYYPIEISAGALSSCERELSNIYGVNTVGLEREYIEGLRDVAQHRNPDTHLLVLFLGSTIGNFDSGSDCQFLSQIRQTLCCGDTVLLGTDLLKPASRLIAAYDDPAGVTAAFNLNLLARINRELDADFDLRQFEHEARFNQITGSVEMHLRSKQKQTVYLPSADCRISFREGETIWTESSHKYSLAEVGKLAHSSGFRCEQRWVDDEWPFAESLFVAI